MLVKLIHHFYVHYNLHEICIFKNESAEMDPLKQNIS